MSSSKFMNIARLMTMYNLQIEEIPDNLKCTNCKLVLKEACLVMCGCTYCRICIDDMMARGLEFCQGVSEDCEASLLSQLVPDYRANNRISKLIVKCPNVGCVYESQLLNMEDHLQECQRKDVECPFSELGCSHDKLAAEEMNEHLQRENSRHSEILIVVIANINREIGMLKEREEYSRREIEILKQRDEASKREIEMLKHELVLNGRQVRSVVDQMIHLENENKYIEQGREDLANRVMILSEKMDREIDPRDGADEIDSARLIEHVDREVATITAMIESHNEGYDSEIKSVRDEIISINQATQSIMEDIYSMKSQVQSIQALVGLVDARCELVIDEHVAETNWSWGDFATDYFTGAVYPYKYRLSLYNPGSAGGSLQIYLRIHDGPSNGQLAWPFEGRVIITVAEKDRREACRSISRQCRIDRPPDNYYRSSDRFDFPHSVLIDAGLDLSRGVCVSCEIIPGPGR